MSFRCQGMESPRSCMPTRRAAVRISGASSCQQGSSPAQEGRCCRRSVLEPECTHNDIERHAVSTTNLNKLTLSGHGNMRKYIDMHSSMFLFLSLSLALSLTRTHSQTHQRAPCACYGPRKAGRPNAPLNSSHAPRACSEALRALFAS